MVKQKVKVTNPTGLHLRPAGNLCKEASKYHAQVELFHDGETYNVKSILSVLSACVKCGEEIELICNGIDEQDALKNLVDVIESGLGE